MNLELNPDFHPDFDSDFHPDFDSDFCPDFTNFRLREKSLYTLVKSLWIWSLKRGSFLI